MTEEQQNQLEDLNDQMIVRREKMEQLEKMGSIHLVSDLSVHIIPKNCTNYLIHVQKKNWRRWH